MTLRRTALLAALAVLASAAPAVAAPTLAPLKPCYVSVLQAPPDDFETEAVVVSGSGFTPGAKVDVRVDGALAQSGVVVDAAGNLPVGAVSAPTVKAAERRFTVTAVEQDSAAQTASAQARVSNLAIKVRPRRARPGQRIRFRGRGFTDPGAAVYAHYLRRGAARPRRTVRLVKRPHGPCGTFSVRRRQFPFTPKAGPWTVQIDQHRAFTADGPLVNLLVLVARSR